MAASFKGGHLFLFLGFIYFLSSSLAIENDLVISTKHGQVQGKLLSVLGGHVRAFLGVPYGKPPVGALRFTAPQPVQGWNGVKDATNFPNSCYQVPDTTYPGFGGAEMWNPNTPVSEDCLYLNIWSPRFNKTQSTLLPVLVWIYGGGFTSGTSSLDIYDGRYLSISENVVVVSMNYRLGAFGFLSLPESKNIMGNAGLLDQRLALQWVASNVAAFGGDPSKVTIFGESAGAAAVGFHLVSPGSQGLFQRAVMQSGSPNAPWATVSQTEAWARAQVLATSLGCSMSHLTRMEDCLQKADPQKIALNQFNVFSEFSLVALPFTPVVDGNFLPDKIEVLLSKPNLPKKEVMIGINKDEGTYFIIHGIPGCNISTECLLTRENFLKGVKFSIAGASDVMREAAIFQYTDWTDDSNKIKNRAFMANLVGDHNFVCPVLEFTHRYSQHGGKTFVYFFDHQSSVNPWPAWMGVMHAYEIEFVFGRPLNLSLGYTKHEVNMTKKFMKHWANFARAGNPGIDGANWPTFTLEHQAYVTLNYNHPEQMSKMRAKECQLWNTFMPQIQNMSDALQTCLNASGIIPCCNYILLFVLVAITLTH